MSKRTWRRRRWFSAGVFAAMFLVMTVAAPAWAQDADGPADADSAPADQQATDQAEPDKAAQEDADTQGGDASDKPWAKGTTREQRHRARAIFLEANQLAKDTLFIQAVAKYKQAIAVWEHPAFYYNLAISQLAQDQPDDAYHSLGKALEYGEAPLGKAKYDHARNYVHLLEQKLARLEVVCELEGAKVTLNGVHLLTGPGRHESIVKPGTHQIVASKAGYLPQTEDIELSAGERRRVEMELVTLSEANEASRRWAAWKPWAVVGGGAALAAIGGVLQWRASQDFQSFDRKFSMLACADQGGCAKPQFAPVASELGRATWEQRIAIGSYVLGGAALVTGVVLLYKNRLRLPDSVAGASETQVSVIPMVSPRVAGVSAGLQF